MGICTGTFLSKATNIDLSRKYVQLTAIIASYTKGLKDRLKETMIEGGMIGTIKKTILPVEKNEEHQGNPIYTEIVAIGPEGDIDEFTEQIKQIVDKEIETEIKTTEVAAPAADAKRKIEVMKTEAKIANRRPSDAGSEHVYENNMADAASKAANDVKGKAKKMLAAVANIPILSEYTGDLEGKWSIKIAETPRILISAVALFHPFAVYSFPLYKDDGPNVLKSCLEWKTGIPSQCMELFTKSGLPITDPDTLIKEANCFFVDIRVTAAFFNGPKEKELKAQMERFTKEPFTFHKMSLHNLTVDNLSNIFNGMEEKRAQSILQEELSISGIIAAQLLSLIKKV